MTPRIGSALCAVLGATAFRLAAAFAGAFAVCVVLLFGFLYWQTAALETARIEMFLVQQARSMAGASAAEALWAVRSSLGMGLHRISLVALFAADGAPLAGNLAALPGNLPIDGMAHRLDMSTNSDTAALPEQVIAVARRSADGRIVVLARSIEELQILRALLKRAFLLGVGPAMLLALAAGAWIGANAGQRVRSWQIVLNRVRDGDLGARLPCRPNGDDIDRLAESVNHAIADMGRLLGELHDVGNNIAHDLRTPLARVRAQLERARRAEADAGQIAQILDRTISDLDQSIAITTALLRIAAIENERRRDGFSEFDFTALVRDVAEFYEPACEAKQLCLTLALPNTAPLFGDRALLFEAVANLIDNAIKFTPAGGSVLVQLEDRPEGPLLIVRDSGPGIPPGVREAVFRRFFRFDPSRQSAGAGLGLSLVSAIVALHGFSIVVNDRSDGCTMLMECWPHPAAGTAPAPVAQMVRA